MTYDLMPHGTKTYKDLHERTKSNRTMPPLRQKYPVNKLRDEKKVEAFGKALKAKQK